VEQRTNAETVAAENQTPARGVVERERELAVDAVDEINPVFLVQVWEHFGIAARRKTVALPRQARAEISVVEDFAIADADDGPLLVEEWLASRSLIDDRKAPKAERHALGGEARLIVRPTVGDCLQHALENAAIRRRPAMRIEVPGDATHVYRLVP
jgi:hypothetical protein